MLGKSLIIHKCQELIIDSNVISKITTIIFNAYNIFYNTKCNKEKFKDKNKKFEQVLKVK